MCFKILALLIIIEKLKIFNLISLERSTQGVVISWLKILFLLFLFLGGDYLVQISGRFLIVTGKNSAKHIDKAWSQERASDVTTIKFSCVLFNSLVPVFSRIKLRFPNVENLIFNECELNNLGQLNALADIQGLTSLEILPDRNAIVKKNWRCYAIYRLHHWGLQTINNEPVEYTANRRYENLE